MIKRETIDAVISSCKIEEVVGDFVNLSRRGVNYVGLCPFHDEKTPSFTVSPAKGIYKCFGCGESGDAVHFVMQHEHYTYVEAIRYLAAKYGIEIEEVKQTPKELQALNEREALTSVSQFAALFFSDSLWKTTEGRNIALSYFYERGFSDRIIEKFKLGYSPANRTALLQYGKSQGYTVENMVKAGLITESHYSGENKYSDRFFGRVIFPIQNFSGKVIAFGGRILHATDKKAAKYVNSPETEIYHKSDTLYGIFQAKTAIHKENKCFLVEGYADVISMYQSGIENIVASSGTSLTSSQVKMIKRLTDNVTIIYDGDSAGIHAAIRAVGMMLKESLNIRIVVLPPEDDPDTFARSHGTQEIKDYISANEKDFIRFKISLFKNQSDSNDPLKQAEFISEIASDIALIPDAITVSIFVKQCSELLGIQENIMMSSVNRVRSRRYMEEKRKTETSKEIKEESETISIQYPLESKKIIHGLSISEVESKILFFLVNHGYKHISLQSAEKAETSIDVRVDEFIFSDLEKDELELETQLYADFYNLYKSFYSENPEKINERINVVDDVNIRELYTSLIDLKPQPSPLWKERRNYIHTIDDENTNLLRDDIIRVLQMYRLLHLRKAKENLHSQLKAETDEEEIILIVGDIQKINTYISEIEKKLGVAYR